MDISWDNTLYEFANECMATSRQKWKQGEIGLSWKYSIPARLAYICDAINNLVILPFAIIGYVYGIIHALCTWNRQSQPYQTYKTYTLERSNHFFMSVFGGIVSPALAHRYRNANIAPYIIVARITVICGGLIYYGFF